MEDLYQRRKYRYPVLFMILWLVAQGSVLPLYAQKPLQGVWMLNVQDTTIQVLFQDGYFVETQYTPETFILSRGGPVELLGDSLHIFWEFDSQASENVGQSQAGSFTRQDSTLSLVLGKVTRKFKHIDAGEDALAGVWHITQRMQDGHLVAIQHTGTRKTLKILTATHFQWFAIDPGKQTFNGTGGGQYTFKNGVYTEHINFFSRDSTRVGASLQFQGALKDGAWHHQGKSSKGQPIYEVWSKVAQ